MKKINFNIFFCVILITSYPSSATSEEKKSELQLLLESLEGTPTPTPEIKSDFELINNEINAQHKRSVEMAEERKKIEMKRMEATPTQDPFITRMDKLREKLSSLRSNTNETQRQTSNKIRELERGKSNFERNVSQRARNRLLTNSDLNWISGIVRNMDQKYNSLTKPISNYEETLRLSSKQIEECITITDNFKNGISNDVASDRQKLNNCESNIQKKEQELLKINHSVNTANLEKQYEVNLSSIDTVIKRRETEERQRNLFK